MYDIRNLIKKIEAIDLASIKEMHSNVNGLHITAPVFTCLGLYDVVYSIGTFRRVC